jgi:hypothetical protein
MANDPKLTQSTAIAKATTTDNRLSSLVPSLTTELSPLRIYQPAATVQKDGSYPVAPYGTWTCPDGIDSVQVECYGGGGGGGGASADPAVTPLFLGSYTGGAGTSFTVPVNVNCPVDPSANAKGSIALYIAAPNNTAQTFTVIDSRGNTYSNIDSAAPSATGVTLAEFSTSGSAVNPLTAGDTITVTTTNSEAAVISAFWVEYASSNAQTAGTFYSSTTTSLGTSVTGTATQLGVVAVYNNSSQGVTPPSAVSKIGPSLSNGSQRLSLYWVQFSVDGTLTENFTVGGAVQSIGAWHTYSVTAPYTAVSGGGGGGGGEYVCEPGYPVIAGETYSYYVGRGGSAAAKNGTGGNGEDSAFDFRGKGIEGGAIAHGGQGGLSNGTGGSGGTGSTNAGHFDGGAGASTLSGVGSDNPAAFFGNSPVQLWWRMDDNPAGTRVLRDYSGKGHNGSIQAASGGTIAPVADSTQPSQIPFDGSNSGELDGVVLKFSKGNSSTIAGTAGTSFGLSSTTAFSVSIWIKGNGTTGWGGSQVVLAENMDGNNLANTQGRGFVFYITSNVLNLSVKDDTGSTTSADINQSLSGLAAPDDGKWHQFTATYSRSGGSTMALYVDGRQVQTGTAAGAVNMGAGNIGLTVGGNWNTGWNGFDGRMANFWFANSVMTPTQVQIAYGLQASRGGSGGGASGGSAGTGSSGSSSSSDTGGPGAPGATGSSSVTNGGAAGSAGGNNAASGTVNAGSPGGGGGGGGGADATVTNRMSVVMSAVKSASYIGLDAQGGGGGSMHTVSLDPQADDADAVPATAAQGAACYAGGEGGEPYNGSMSSIVQFPNQANVPVAGNKRLVDVTPFRVYLTITINNTTESSMLFFYGTPNAIPDTFEADDSGNFPVSFTSGGALHIPAGDAGRQLTFDITSSTLISTLTSTAGNGGICFVFGPCANPADVAGGPHQHIDQWWNDSGAEDWYVEFFGAGTADGVNDMQLTVEYYDNSAPVISGAGGNGRILINFIDNTGTPVTTVLATAETDANGNQLAQGVTTSNVQTWQPGSNPRKLETWHDLRPLSNSFTGTNTGFYPPQYRINALSHVEFTGAVSLPGSGQNAVFNSGTALPAAYRPNLKIQLPLSGLSVNGTTSMTNVPCLVVNPDGTLNFTNLPTPSSGTVIRLDGLSYPVDATGIIQS